MDLTIVIDKLRSERRIFHSEDDLKFAFAHYIKELYPMLDIRLEVPLDIEMQSIDSGAQTVRVAVDIIAIDNEYKKVYPIEIKYKTKQLNVNDGNEIYQLRNHGAPDVGRYSFRKDIYRLENVEAIGFGIEKGYLLILTNDESYLIDNTNLKGNIDRHFSFHDGANIESEYLGWNYENTDLTKYYTSLQRSDLDGLRKHWTLSKEFNYILTLKNHYTISWKNYSTVLDTKNVNRKFCYCLLDVLR